jgi:hypothetical protein
MERIALETTSVAILAEGSTPSEVANARGHLLETFVAQLLSTQGYGEPTTENLNVTVEGVEIDVAATHRVTHDRLICECKAYSSNIRAPLLTSFLGKFAMAKADDPACHGLFVGLPRLTPDALEQAKSAEQKLDGFRYLGSYDVCDLLADAQLLPSLADGPSLAADPTVIVTEHGLALAARELDPETRHAFRVVVWTKAGLVPSPLLRLVERNWAEALPVVTLGAETVAVPIRVGAAPTVVEVQGSTSDFEYQLPAAPAFFVGRKLVASGLTREVCDRRRAGVVVINAKSGWGKSSLSLHLQREVEKAGGVALVIDTRTAERPDFVAVAMERLIREALAKGIVTLPGDATFSSIGSTVETLRSSTWGERPQPALIVFDQFENVFRSFELTREFRDLAFLVKDLDLPLTVGFSWKTDMVGWTEDHPYRLRDEIREAASVVVLDPFGAREVETLLRRLEKAVGDKLHRELRQRLREYSQGLPWLFKKLAGHILAEVGRGISQEQLLRQSLNVQALFEADLGRLSPGEQEALRTIARAAPVLISEIDENTIARAVLESLMHQRLVVQVGERLDIYWDTFRDFLTSGRVSIEDSYIVRYAPLGAGKLLRAILSAGGELSVSEAAQQLNTSSTVVFNYARELRLFGVLTAEPNRVLVEPSILGAPDTEEAIRTRVSSALRQHKMHALAMDLISEASGELSIADFAQALPPEFPTVEAKADSWFTYARSFCQWMEYAGIVELRRDGMTRRSEEDVAELPRMLTGAIPVRLRSAFPSANPGPALELLRHLADPASVQRPAVRRVRAAVRDLSLLGAIELDARQRIVLSDAQLVQDGRVDEEQLRVLAERQKGVLSAFEALRKDPAASPSALGRAHRAALGADWVESTTLSVGKYLRAWARTCGIRTELRPPREPVEPDAMSRLF